MFPFLSLASEGNFLGTFSSNNNFFFVGKKADRATKLQITYSESLNLTTTKITIQARFYSESFLNSRSYLFCGQGYYWPALNKLETHLYLDICKESELNEREEYGLAETAGIDWPTDDQLKHNESINSNPDDCTFTFYGKLEEFNTKGYYVPPDLHDKYSYLSDSHQVSGFVVSQDCGITFEFKIYENVPRYQEFLTIISMVISIGMLLLGLLSYNILKENPDSDFIIVGTGKWENMDIYVEFILMFYSVVSYMQIAFLLSDQLNRLVFCSFIGMLELCFVDYRILRILLSRSLFTSSHISPWVLGLLFVLLLVVIIVLSYCFIEKFYVECQMVILGIGLLIEVFRLFKPLVANYKIGLKFTSVAIICSYYFTTNCYLYLSVYYVTGRNNSLHFEKIGLPFLYFLALSTLGFILNISVGIYLKYRRTYKIDQEAFPFRHSYLKELTPDHYEENGQYIALPFAEPYKACHNPLHAHSSYFGKENLLLADNFNLAHAEGCFLIVEREKIMKETCEICLDPMDMLSERENRLYDLNVKYGNEGLEHEEPSEAISFGLPILPQPVFFSLGGEELHENVGFKLEPLNFPFRTELPFMAKAVESSMMEVVEDDFEMDEDEDMAELGPPRPFLPPSLTGGFSSLRYNVSPTYNGSQKESIPADLHFPVKVAAVFPGWEKCSSLCILKCGHVFHRTCMNFAVRSGNVECPICKSVAVIPMSACWRRK